MNKIQVFLKLFWWLLAIYQVKSECCYSVATDVVHECLGEGTMYEQDSLGIIHMKIYVEKAHKGMIGTYTLCTSNLCGDGTLRHFYGYCGHGPCNMFGCNCDGGCRKGDKENAIRMFRDEYGLDDELTYQLVIDL